MKEMKIIILKVRILHSIHNRISIIKNYIIIIIAFLFKEVIRTCISICEIRV